jgi:hypothetical protein
MDGVLGSDVVATLVAPSTPPMGARIEALVTRAVASYWRPAVFDPLLGEWTVVLEAPVFAGEYNLVWRDGGPEPPASEVVVPLTVRRAA